MKITFVMQLHDVSHSPPHSYWNISTILWRREAGNLTWYPSYMHHTYSLFGLCSPFGISNIENSNFTRSRFCASCMPYMKYLRMESRAEAKWEKQLNRLVEDAVNKSIELLLCSPANYFRHVRKWIIWRINVTRWFLLRQYFLIAFGAANVNAIVLTCEWMWRMHRH